MAKQKQSGKGGSPKKQIKRLRRKAVATLRQARLTAQLELIAAEASAAQIREAAHAAAAEETATLRADAHSEVERIREQGRADAVTAATAAAAEVATELRNAADAQARAVLAEAELKAARITRDAESDARARRDQIVAEAMQEAATIRAAATEEITGFLRRLDAERSMLLEAARDEATRVVADARSSSATDLARLRDATEQETARKAAEVLEQASFDARQIVERAEAEAKATRAEAEALASAAKIAAEAPPATPESESESESESGPEASEPEPGVTASAPTPAPRPPDSPGLASRPAPAPPRPTAPVVGTVVTARLEEVHWRAEVPPGTNGTTSNGTNGTHANGTGSTEASTTPDAPGADEAPASPPAPPAPTTRRRWFFGRGKEAPRADSSAALQLLVEARGLTSLMVALGEVRGVASCVGIEARRELELAVALVEVRGNRFTPRHVLVDLGQCRQACARTVGLADRDRTVEPDDRRVGEPEELVVPLDDLDPVGLLDSRRVGVERGDRRLRLVLAELIARQRSPCEVDALGDERGVPQTAVLLGERHDASVRSGAAAPPGLVQQHQGEQAVDLGVVHERRQLPGEPDGLGREIDVARISLVEHEVEHSHHRAHVARTIDTGVTHRALGAADALRHGALGHEVGLRDLACGETTHRAEGQRDR
jgi:hypothetical protein